MDPRPLGLTCLSALVLLLCCAGNAQARDREPDYQQWVQLYATLKLPHRLRAELDLQSRRLNAPLRRVETESGQVSYQPNPNTILLLRPLVGYDFTPWLTAYLGYLWTPDYFDNPEVRSRSDISEHRIFVQLTVGHTFGKFNLGGRTRVEQRVRTDGPGSPENDAGYTAWAQRVRQMARLAYRLGDSPFLLIAWDEIFIHLNRTNYPSKPGLDQNRAFLGLGYQAEPMLRLEFGYTNVFVRRYTDPNQINHVLQLAVVFTYDASRGM
jgi:hypothetical protein